MRKGGIRLSSRHGVNPSIGQCFLCLKDFEVILFGQLKSDQQAPTRTCLGPESVCSQCEEYKKQGIVLISVDAAKSPDHSNPWRTGGWVVVREEAIQRSITPPELAAHILKARFAFVPDDAWDLLGLPRDEKVNANAETTP